MTNDKWERVSKSYQLDSPITADDVGDAVRLVLSTVNYVDKITINVGKMDVDFLVNVDKTPEEWTAGESAFDLDSLRRISIKDTLSTVQMKEVSKTSINKVNLRAIQTITAIMSECSANSKSGVMWIVGDMPHFCKWLGVKPNPTQLLGVPIIAIDAVPNDKIVLLGAASYRSNPINSDSAFFSTMVIDSKSKKEE